MSKTDKCPLSPDAWPERAALGNGAWVGRNPSHGDVCVALADGRGTITDLVILSDKQARELAAFITEAP